MKLCARAEGIRDEYLANAANAAQSAVEREIAACGGADRGQVQGFRTMSAGARLTMAKKVNAHMSRCKMCSP